MTRQIRLAALGLGLAWAPAALADPPSLLVDGFSDTGRDLEGRPADLVQVEGYLRTRGSVYDDLDLSRGPTPTGQLFFPTPLSNPSSHVLTSADMRFRTDLAFYGPGGGVAVKARIDTLDNVALGSLPEGTPQGSAYNLSPPDAVKIKRAYGEALTPLGLLTVGRMGNNWGLGISANGGDCLDCDYGDSADRIAFVTPLLGHIWAVAFDFSAAGPLVAQPGHATVIGLDPSTDVHTLNFAVLGYHDAEALERRRLAGKATFDYGAYYSHRWQENDVPIDYLPIAGQLPVTPAQVVPRGFTADALDGWARLVTPHLRLEAEGVVLLGSVQQASLIPGVLLPQPVTLTQYGGALESDVGAGSAPFAFGVDTGLASGDSAPGFGAFPQAGQAPTKPGALDGPQANPPFDNSINNFTFSPDYHIDRILFREIIGTVTDTYYLKPHLRWRVFEAGRSKLTAQLAAVASWALFAASAPGDAHALGLEIDPTLTYDAGDGFLAELQYATLFPFAGLDNVQLNLHAQPAQFVKLLLAFVF